MAADKAKQVVVGLSGGVDSAVAALLLKEQGWQVSAIFMQNWQADDADPYCTLTQDLADAKHVADKLKIPLEVVNFSDEYWQKVFQYFLDEYAAGRTPNPDVMCNKEIKFKAFLNYVLEKGIDTIATGHYARQDFCGDRFRLLKGLDENKDQSYFLYLLNQEQLKHSLFPLGTYQKSEVRALAKKAGLPNHSKKDSTGICFIGERKFKDFLNQYLLKKPGNIVDENDAILGRHDGLMFYTLGQRQGIGLGGCKGRFEAPWYVIKKDLVKNELIVSQNGDHPFLQSKKITCDKLHWISGALPADSFACAAKIRYRQKDQACQVTRISDSQYEVVFNEPVRAATPGQSVVFYKDEECLGGGIIV